MELGDLEQVFFGLHLWQMQDYAYTVPEIAISVGDKALHSSGRVFLVSNEDEITVVEVIHIDSDLYGAVLAAHSVVFFFTSQNHLCKQIHCENG